MFEPHIFLFYFLTIGKPSVFQSSGACNMCDNLRVFTHTYVVAHSASSSCVGRWPTNFCGEVSCDTGLTMNPINPNAGGAACLNQATLPDCCTQKHRKTAFHHDY